ncbi:hypothetical protein BB561_003209 [Smittium simulii]|uniref:ATP-dependent (S)-NAD(P)H-hydrate dehydratase n=1 Tax=Smittium simulii TaxID=133385 RepID=A0A2T9YMP4_9FUNG|nr:hypothetical protein BB561_003209 [Smittium simulii]
METIDSACRKLIPVLHRAMHKGDCGRIGVFGGCEEYTGAPYFAAATALKMGADISYLFCEKAAGHVIKTYSPELIVLPYLRSTNATNSNYSLADIQNKIVEMSKKIHAFSIGSGLGHDSNMQESMIGVLKHAKYNNIPTVLDADIIQSIAKNPELVYGKKNAILTPNVNEFKSLILELKLDNTLPTDQIVKNCALALGGVTIILKGENDIISNGETILICDELGGLKRCGGQGDILAGATATFLGWSVCYQQRRWNHDSTVPTDKMPLLCAYAACKVIRIASRLAFEANDFSTQPSDVLIMVPKSLKLAFETKTMPHGCL